MWPGRRQCPAIPSDAPYANFSTCLGGILLCTVEDWRTIEAATRRDLKDTEEAAQGYATDSQV